MRKLVLAALVGLVSVVLPSARSNAVDAGSFRLKPGESVFWDGPWIDAAGPGTYALGLAEVCEVTNPCFDYAIELSEPVARLRVALDQPSADDTFELQLRDPSGEVVVTANTHFPSIGTFSVEILVDHAEQGAWSVRVIPEHAVRTTFRMRAKAERRVSLPPANRFVLPDVRMAPPFEIGFDACQATEMVRHEAERCLRFAIGPENVGPGPLDLRIRDAGETEGPMYQRIYRGDGSYEEVPAGRFSFHVEHNHYHHVGTGAFELYRVEDAAAGRLSADPVATGPKVGNCMAASAIARWKRFDQDDAHNLLTEHLPEGCTGMNADGPRGMTLGLPAGWSDTYFRTTEGNYIDFKANGDGLYVMRATSDPEHTFTESDATNNVSYAYISVKGDDVRALERGYGQSPWDPNKVLTDDIRLPTPKGT
jgi:hypothetical protein